MYVATGSFIIRGKRNFLQPQRLELGFTLMYCISEESLSNHLGERNSREGAPLDDEISLDRTSSIRSALTVEDVTIEDDGGDAIDVADDEAGASVIEKLLKSQNSMTGKSVGFLDEMDDDRITIVQVGEKAREFNAAGPGAKGAANKNVNGQKGGEKWNNGA